jgi:CheY-like chemotaxis protein
VLPEGVMNPALVLLVEDDPTVAESVVLALRDRAEVTIASSVHAARELIATGRRFEAILCKVTMQGAGAIELYCDLIRTDLEAADALIFVVEANMAPRTRAFISAVDVPWLRMPLDESELRTIVRDRKDRRLYVSDSLPTRDWPVRKQ